MGLFLFEIGLAASCCMAIGRSARLAVSPRAEADIVSSTNKLLLRPAAVVPVTGVVLAAGVIDVSVFTVKSVLLDCFCLSSLRRASNFSENEGVEGEIPCLSFDSGFI